MLLLLACDRGSDVVDVPQTDGCENIDELDCLLPWPSDRFLVEDPGTATGWRVAYEAETLPANVDGTRVDPAIFGGADGFPIGARALVQFERAPDLSEVAFHDSIERSLRSDHAFVVVDMETGQRVPHWVELDLQADVGQAPTVIINFATTLSPDRDYAVGVRGLRDLNGAELSPSTAFAALRAGKEVDAPDLRARKARFEHTFDALEGVGVPREELLVAWSFHTASESWMHRDLLHMRDDALARLGEEGIGCTVESVEEEFSAAGYTVARRVRGTYTVPSYMDSATPPALLVRDENGLPTWVDDVEVPFTAIIPHSVAEADGPRRWVTYGHGLMGEGEGTISNEMFLDLAEVGEASIVATDWAGMSTRDASTVALALADLSRFVYTAERLEQGMINQIALTRSFMGKCRDLPEFQFGGHSAFDPAQAYFVGGSQGGILGGTLLAISPDIQRGVLMVNGSHFPFLMDRSIDFVPYMPIFESWYSRRVDRLLLLEMASHLWEWTDSAGYMAFLTEGGEGLEPKTVLSVAAKNDQQVTNLGTDYAMRSAGVPVVQGSAREPWGFDVKAAPIEGSAAVTIDVGDREPPAGNEPADFSDEGHTLVGWEPSTRAIVFGFLQPEGAVTMPCEGTCDPD